MRLGKRQVEALYYLRELWAAGGGRWVPRGMIDVPGNVLASLRERGLVEQGDVYCVQFAITPAGEAALKAWKEAHDG